MRAKPAGWGHVREQRCRSSERAACKPALSQQCWAPAAPEHSSCFLLEKARGWVWTARGCTLSSRPHTASVVACVDPGPVPILSPPSDERCCGAEHPTNPTTPHKPHHSSHVGSQHHKPHKTTRRMPLLPFGLARAGEGRRGARRAAGRRQGSAQGWREYFSAFSCSFLRSRSPSAGKMQLENGVSLEFWGRVPDLG